jgi:hypothetical protein
MANDKSIGELERDVEQARARVAADLARLREPETFDSARKGVMDAANGYKDEAIGAVRERVNTAAQDFVDAVKAKVAANPAAALAIAAGVGWRLYRHPPIASLLIGAGVVGLMRADLEDDSLTPRRLGRTVAEKASALKDRASEQIAELTENATGAAQEKLHEWSAAAERAYDDMTDRMSHAGATRSASDRAGAQRVSPDATPAGAMVHGADSTYRSRSQPRPLQVEAEQRRDAYLLGFAALALGAAVGVARRRREEEEIVYKPGALPVHTRF